MGAITVNRTLFVGLGGQGQIALAAVKRRLLDAYGEIPPMVRFLALDAAGPSDPAVFDAGEFQRISFSGAAEWVDENRDRLSSWFDFQGIPRKYLDNVQQGAGQIPQIGRLLMLHNMGRILRLVTTNMKTLFGDDVTKDSRWAVAKSRPQVIFFGSIAGGTGSGTLLDLACAMRNVTRAKGGHAPMDWSHHAFLVLPGVFTQFPNAFFVQRNGYAFLQQLDFMLSERDAIFNGEHDGLFDVTSFDGTRYQLIDPFDSVTLVGYMAAGEGDAFFLANPQDLAAAVGEVMYALTGEFADDSGGIGDPLRQVLVNPSNHARKWKGNKQCWYSGVGMSTLRFPRGSFRTWAETVFASRLITAMSVGEEAGERGRPDELVESFLAFRSLHELGEQNQIMNAILPAPRIPVQVPDAKVVSGPDDVERIWHTNLAALDTGFVELSAQADLNLAALLETTKDSLEARVDEVVSTYGSQTAASFVNQLRGYFQDVRKEMNDEGAQAAEETKRHTNAATVQKVKCIEASKKLRKTNAVKNALDEHRPTLLALSRARTEEIRHSRAGQFCSAIDVVLSEVHQALEARADALADLEKLSGSRVHAAASEVERAATNPAVIGVYPDPGELRLPQPNPADFYTWYRESSGDAVTKFWMKPVGDAWRCLIAYAEERHVAESLGDISLISTVTGASDDRRKRYLERADQRSQPLLSVSKGRTIGLALELQPATIYYVAAHPEFRSAYQDPPLSDRLLTLDVEAIMPLDLSDKDSAHFFRHWGCVPAYALSEFPEMRAQYKKHTQDRQQWCLHLDKRWTDRLPDLDPTEENSDSQWVWVLASSDIDYLRRVQRAVNQYSFGYERPQKDGSVQVETQNLGKDRKAARDAFLANREWVEQCRERIEAALTEAFIQKDRNAVLDDLRGYRERLKVETTIGDEARRSTIDKDIAALTGFIADVQ